METIAPQVSLVITLQRLKHLADNDKQKTRAFTELWKKFELDLSMETDREGFHIARAYLVKIKTIPGLNVPEIMETLECC